MFLASYLSFLEEKFYKKKKKIKIIQKPLVEN